jgi:CBS domain-containing protein
MQVHQILKTKQDAEVVSVPRGTLVKKVAEILTKRRIGTVVVSDDGIGIFGILSERDIVRALAQKGAGCLLSDVDMFMTKNVQTCALSDSGDAILARMTLGRFRHMPVMQHSRLVGLVTIGDVVKSRLSELTMENQALEGMIKGF